MICIFPYFCPYKIIIREIRESLFLVIICHFIKQPCRFPLGFSWLLACKYIITPAVVLYQTGTNPETDYIASTLTAVNLWKNHLKAKVSQKTTDKFAV
jgi:hypothetical protein